MQARSGVKLNHVLFRVSITSMTSKKAWSSLLRIVVDCACVDGCEVVVCSDVVDFSVVGLASDVDAVEKSFCCCYYLLETNSIVHQDVIQLRRNKNLYSLLLRG